MKFTKAILCVILISLSAVLFCACGQDSDSTTDNPKMTIDIIKNSDGSKTEVKNGGVQYFFPVKDGESYNLELGFKTECGQIDVLVTNTDMDNKIILSENNITTDNLSIEITEPGTYRVYFEVKDFTGHYSYDFIKN